MKKISLCLVVFGVLMLSSFIGRAQCTTPINTFPYVEDFETSAAWTTGGPLCTPLNQVINDWVWAGPHKNVINRAGSGQRCWIVGDSVGWLYAYGERSWVQSPCFDFSNVQRPFFQCKIFWESEYKYDGTVLQYSTDGGTTWTDVGAYGDPVDCMNDNWFNYTGITHLSSYSGQISGHGNTTQNMQSLCIGTPASGWCGNIQASYHDTSGVGSSTCQGGNGSGGWVTAKHCMPNLAGKPSVIFRFAFGAGTSCNNFNGFAFDSVAIGEGTPNSADFTSTCVNSNTLHFTGVAPLCPDTFQWDFGDPASGTSNTVTGAGTLTPTHTFSGPGTYNVTFTVKGGPCNAPGSVTKTVNIISVNTAVTQAGCTTPGSAIATVSGNVAPYTYTWSTTPTQTGDTATNLSPGTYTVSVTSAGACSATATAVIGSTSGLQVSIDTAGVSCHNANDGMAIAIHGGQAPYTYVWSNQATTDTISHLSAGSYSVTVTDATSCTGTAGIVLSNPDSLYAVAVLTPDTCARGVGSIAINVTGGAGPYSYLWTPGGSTSAALSTVTAGAYTVLVTDAHHCTATDEYMVGDSCANDSLVWPSAFSPNGDNKNETFGPVYIGFVTDYELHIYNRWGQLVFESTDPNKGWDGTYKGVQQPTGLYDFFANYTEASRKYKEGILTLVR